jgi:hypothetical protein
MLADGTVKAIVHGHIFVTGNRLTVALTRSRKAFTKAREAFRHALRPFRVLE